MTKNWQSMRSAPRDGTVVEIKNSYGILSTFGLFRWERDRWRYATDPNRGLIPGREDHLAWRPYAGDPAAYVDYSPSMDDWRRAMSR